MKKVIDACGLSCPEPVLKLKRAIAGASEIELLSDSSSAVENCRRYAESQGFSVSVVDESGKYTMKLAKG